MNTILLTTLEIIYRGLASGKAYDLIVKTVSELMEEDLTNDEKRAKVKAAVMPIMRDFGKAWLSVIIAFAVKTVQLKIEAENGRVQNN